MLVLLAPTLFKLRDDIVVVAILVATGRGKRGVKFYNDTTNGLHRSYFAARH